jgi:rhodanese-related sulfurtransferase
MKIDLDLNKKLAIVVVAVAFFSIFLGSPKQGKTVEVDTQKITQAIQYKQDSICIRTLADWLVAGRADFIVVDVRSEKEYMDYHIPTARNISVSELDETDLLRNRRIIIYSSNDIKTAQAWFILRARGYENVYMIYGGIVAWKKKILFPEIPDEPGAVDKPKYAKMIEISEFFGGKPEYASGNMPDRETKEIDMPEIRQPAQVEIKRKKKPTRQGC